MPYCLQYYPKDHKTKIDSVRYASLSDTGSIFTTLHYIALPPLRSTQFDSTPIAVMPKSCIICSAVASPDIMLQYCAACQSALYCSRACQRKDWKPHHKKICKLINVGHGDMQVRTDEHENRKIEVQKIVEQSISDGQKRFFKLFEESTFEGSRDAAQKMKKYAKRQTKNTQEFLLSQSMSCLIRSNSDMLSWPNSPLLVMLQFVDPNVLYHVVGDEASSVLHLLADLADPFDYSTHVNQLILAKQLIEHGANVNGVSDLYRRTPLHRACYSGAVTNLDFVEYLLEEGADPNARDYLEMTPLFSTCPHAPGAAKFLLNWPTTDANITTRSGRCFLAVIRSLITDFSEQIALPEDSERIQHQFKLQQWREIEEILVERGALDTGSTALA
jgi:hypothetical protein